MNAIVQTQAKVPSYIAAAISPADLDDSLSVGVGSGGYPVFSIKGAKWRIVQNKEETLITIPGTDDAAPSIEVVVLKANKGLSKVWYAGAYTEGSDSAPDCFSHDGIAPDSSVENPPSQRCASCPNNVWGSKITPQGSKVKACADSRRLAVVAAGDLGNPMLLRVPAASLADLAEFGRQLQRRGVPYHAVVTKLGFDPKVAYPKITFKPVKFVAEEDFPKVLEVRDNPLVDEICGITIVPRAPRQDAAPAQPAAQPAAQARPAAQAKPAPAPEPEQPVQDAAVEDTGLFEEPAQVAATTKPRATKAAAKKAEPAVATGNLEADLDNLLAGFDT